MNLLLQRMTESDRELLAQMLQQEYESAIHDALIVLHEEGIEPFEDGYFADPFHDFVARLDGWQWPHESSSSRVAIDIGQLHVKQYEIGFGAADSPVIGEGRVHRTAARFSNHLR